MKPLLSSRALTDLVHQFFTSRVAAASSAASYVRRTSLLGFRTANPTHPSLLSACAIVPGQVTGIHSTPVFHSAKAPEDAINDEEKHKPGIEESIAVGASEEPLALHVFGDKDQEISRSRVDLRSRDRPTLDDIMKWELLLDESTEKIRNLWLDYHGKQWRRQGDARWVASA